MLFIKSVEVISSFDIFLYGVTIKFVFPFGGDYPEGGTTPTDEEWSVRSPKTLYYELLLT